MVPVKLLAVEYSRVYEVAAGASIPVQVPEDNV